MSGKMILTWDFNNTLVTSKLECTHVKIEFFSIYTSEIFVYYHKKNSNFFVATTTAKFPCSSME